MSYCRFFSLCREIHVFKFFLIFMWIFKFNKFCMAMLLKDMHIILLILFIFMFNYMAVKVVFVSLIETVYLFVARITTILDQLLLGIFIIRGELFGIHCLEWKFIIEWILVRRGFAIRKLIVLSWFEIFFNPLWGLVFSVRCHFFNYLWIFIVTVFFIDSVRIKNSSEQSFIVCLIVSSSLNTLWKITF